jgi:hypothetical protein
MITRVQNKRTHTHACLKHNARERMTVDLSTGNSTHA